MNERDFLFGALAAAIYRIAGEDGEDIIETLDLVKRRGDTPNFMAIADLLGVPAERLVKQFRIHFFCAVDRHIRFTAMIAAVEHLCPGEGREVIAALRRIEREGGDALVSSIAQILGKPVEKVIAEYQLQL